MIRDFKRSRHVVKAIISNKIFLRLFDKIRQCLPFCVMFPTSSDKRVKIMGTELFENRNVGPSKIGTEAELGSPPSLFLFITI